MIPISDEPSLQARHVLRIMLVGRVDEPAPGRPGLPGDGVLAELVGRHGAHPLDDRTVDLAGLGEYVVEGAIAIQLVEPAVTPLDVKPDLGRDFDVPDIGADPGESHPSTCRFAIDQGLTRT